MRTCTIKFTDKQAFQLLDDAIDNEIAALLRIKYETARRENPNLRFAGFLIDSYEKNKYRNYQEHVFTGNSAKEEAYRFYNSYKEGYPLTKAPRRIASTNKWEVYIYSPDKYREIFLKIQNTFEKNEAIELEQALKSMDERQRAGNWRENEDGDIVDYLIDISSQYELLITRKEEELILINKNIATAKNNKDADEVEKLLKLKENVESTINELSQKPNFQDILNIADLDIQDIESIFNKPNVSKSDLFIVKHKMDFWLSDKVKDAFFEEEDKLDEIPNYKAYLEMQSKFGNYLTRWENVASHYLNAIITDTTGINFTVDELKELRKKLLDPNLGQSLFRGLSMDTNIYIQAIDRKIKEANEFARQETLAYIKKLNTATNNLIKKVGSRDPEKLYKLFLQLNPKGKKTGQIVHPFSQAFFNSSSKSKVRDKDNRTQIKNRAKWIKDNTITFDNRILFYEDYLEMEADNFPSKYTQEERDNYIAELKKHLGSKLYDFYYERNKEKFEIYKSRFNEIKDDESINLEEWRKKWSPFYITYQHSQGLASPGFEGWDYITNVPRRFNSKGENTGWYDSNFDKIQSDEAYYDYYKFLIDSVSKFKAYFPSTDDLQVNYLPELRESPILSQFTYNPKGLTRKTYDFFVEQISENEVFQDKTDILNNTIRTLPAYMMSNNLSQLSQGEKLLIEDEAKEKYPDTTSVEFNNLVKQLSEQKIAQKINQKSFDLYKVLTALSTTAEVYKHKARVEDLIKLAHNDILNAEKLTVDPVTGNPIKSIFGKKSKTKGLGNLIEQFEHTFDVFYGLGTKKIPGKKIAKDWESRDRVKKLTDELTNLQKLPQSDETLKKIEQTQLKLDELQRTFVTSNAIDLVLKYLHVKSLGWNPFSAITNLGFGFISNYTYGHGGLDFNTKELTKAYKLLMNNVFRATGVTNMKTAVKISELMMEFGVIGDIREGYTQKPYTDLKSKFKFLLPYEMTSRAEFINQGSTFLAMMFNKKIENLKGEKKSLWEAYKLNENNDLVWNTQEFGEKPDWENLGKDKLKFKLKVEKIKKIIHGNYDPNDPVAIKKTVLGRAFMMFRSWVAEGFAARFEAETPYDIDLERARKGRYRSLLKSKDVNDNEITGFKPFMSVLKEMARIFSGGLYNNQGINQFSEVDKANLKRNAAELSFYLAMFALVTLLKGLSDDEDDKESLMVMNFLINTLMRLHDDIDFYTNPLSFEKLQRNSIPPMSFITDCAKIGKGVIRYINGEDGTNGSTPLHQNVFKVFPLGFPYYRTQYLLENLQN